MEYAERLTISWKVMSNREYIVQIDGVCSSPKTISYGVPQTTVLGPLLFNMYINSMLYLKTTTEIISFVNDMATVYIVPNW